MKTYQSTTSELQLKRIPSDFKKVKITGAKDAADYCRQFFFDDLTIYESFFWYCLTGLTIR